MKKEALMHYPYIMQILIITNKLNNKKQSMDLTIQLYCLQNRLIMDQRTCNH